VRPDSFPRDESEQQSRDRPVRDADFISILVCSRLDDQGRIAVLAYVDIVVLGFAMRERVLNQRTSLEREIGLDTTLLYERSPYELESRCFLLSRLCGLPDDCSDSSKELFVLSFDNLVVSISGGTDATLDKPQLLILVVDP